MQTQDAIATLQAMAATLADEVKGSQAKLDAVNLAITQLQGVLTTQNTELDDAKTQLATAAAQLAILQPDSQLQHVTPPAALNDVH